jgi:MinD-like ATPase involved in chromosome partitioning or flagellar assembly
MAQMGKHVVLADIDLGTASLPPDAGIMHPKPGLQASLDKNARHRVGDAISVLENPPGPA